MNNDIEKLKEEAIQWAKDNGPWGIFSVFPSRSCWNCNPAHNWMKTDMKNPYQCFVCNHVYSKGEQLN